jgi:F-type H+-transporting ATP synthase subunit e
VARYTALFSGVLYGFFHNRSLQKAHDLDKEHHVAHHRESLIKEAKEAWKKKQEAGKDGGGECLVHD